MTLTLLAVLSFALALVAYATIRWAEESERLDHNLEYLLLSQEFCDELDRETGRWR